MMETADFRNRDDRSSGRWRDGSGIWRVLRKLWSAKNRFREKFGRIVGTRWALPNTDRTACPRDDVQLGRAAAAVTSRSMAQLRSRLDVHTIVRVAGDVLRFVSSTLRPHAQLAPRICFCAS